LNNAIHVYGTRSFDSFKGCLLWNSFPRAITDVNSHAVSKEKLKCFLSESMLI